MNSFHEPRVDEPGTKTNDKRIPRNAAPTAIPPPSELPCCRFSGSSSRQAASWQPPPCSGCRANNRSHEDPVKGNHDQGVEMPVHLHFDAIREGAILFSNLHHPPSPQHHSYPTSHTPTYQHTNTLTQQHSNTPTHQHTHPNTTRICTRIRICARTGKSNLYNLQLIQIPTRDH